MLTRVMSKSPDLRYCQIHQLATGARDPIGIMYAVFVHNPYRCIALDSQHAQFSRRSQSNLVSRLAEEGKCSVVVEPDCDAEHG